MKTVRTKKIRFLTGITLFGLFLLSGITLAFGGNFWRKKDAGKGTLKEQNTTASFFAMDTIITMEVHGGEEGAALKEAEALLGRLEGKWSATKPGSEIYALNHSHKTPKPVSEETQTLISFALKTAEETGGAFNPLLYPVVKAWGFTTREYRIPGEEELRQLLAHTDYRSVLLEEGTAALKEGMEMDLGAVAKGYAGDLVVEEMKNYGVTSGIINLGGNVALIGRTPKGEPWKVGIRSPYGEGTIGVLEAADCHIITSGGYERYFIGEDGQTYWHILNPDTGYPADSGLISATIVGKEGKLCDALSTAVFVMGRQRAEDYWRSRRDFEMILITSDNAIYMTEGIEESFFLNEMSQGIPVHVIKR